MENQLKVKKAKSLNKYINEKRNQDECLGFIHGYEQALEDIKASEMFEILLKMCEFHEKNASWDKGDNGYYEAKKILKELTNF